MEKMLHVLALSTGAILVVKRVSQGSHICPLAQLVVDLARTRAVQAQFTMVNTTARFIPQRRRVCISARASSQCHGFESSDRFWGHPSRRAWAHAAHFYDTYENKPKMILPPACEAL